MELPDWIEQLLLGGGGGAVVAVGLFTFLVQNRIKHQLDKRLEQAKSEISFHAAQRMSLHNKEYEVFPEIWSRLIDAKASLQRTLLEFRSMPDFNRMADDDFKKWLEGIDLEDDEKGAMLEADDRIFLFNRILDHRHLRKAEETFLEFQTYLQKNRIFLSTEIKKKFDLIQKHLRYAWAERTTNIRLGDKAGRVLFLDKELNILFNKIEPLMEEIEDIIQGKLFPEREAE